MSNVIKRSYRQFKAFLRNHTKDDNQQALVNIMILGTATILLVFTVCLTVAALATGILFARVTLPYVAAAMLLSYTLYEAVRGKYTHLGGVLLVFIHLGLGIALMFQVGVGAGAIVLFCTAAAVAATFYGLWFALVPTLLSTAALFAFRAAELGGHVHPNYIFVPRPDSYASVVVVAILLHALTLACGLVHSFLTQASQRLQAAEAEKLQQLNRFAEIGEISTALIHDMANSLSSLNLEVENLTRGVAATSVKQKVRRLNKVLNTARRQMNGHGNRVTFDAAKEITHSVASLQVSARTAHVTLEWSRPAAPIPYSGEKFLFQQILTILIKNAIDSYAPARKPNQSKRRVHIRLTATPSALMVTVADWGKGIRPDAEQRIFEPFYSTKKDGMGVGLYLTKRFIEDSFGGTIAAQTQNRKTVFTVNLPRSKSKPAKTTLSQ